MGRVGLRLFIGLLGSLAAMASASAADVTSVFNYTSTVSSDTNGALDLTAELNYDSTLTNAPIMVLMHGYSTPTGYSAVRTQAQRLRDEGFFVISVSLRGRDGSDGVRDSGGVEIYDIYDAVEAVKKTYASHTDTASVSITGVSGGGGNVMSALTKFPDYFRVGASYFGMSDYGYDSTNGWYNNGANSGGKRTTELDRDIGNPNTGGSAVLDRYMARASNLASKNNPYTEIHLFVNANEPICPVVNDTSYKNNAVAAASYAGEFDNITVHIGEAGTYYDFDGDGVNDSNEQQYWPHGAPTADQQASSESWYVQRLLNGEIAQPVLNSSDDLYVAGFVKTTPFEFWLGDGQNAAGDLTYSLSSTSKTFHLEVLSSDLSVASSLKVDTEDMEGKEIQVLLDGELVDTFTGGDVYQYAGLVDGSTVTFSVVPEPGTCALLAAGAAAFGMWRIRRRR
ncbi:MAG: S9 family peptidase [Planctomycetaceae bacterium]|nr:S9 family peptidase [Planctomycetaceae bacterium]